MITLYNFAFSLSPGLSVEAFYIKGRGKIVVTKGQLLELGFSSGTTMGIQAILKAGRLSSVPKTVSQPISMLQLPITSMISRQAINSRVKDLTILQINARTLQESPGAGRITELSEICETNNVDIVILCKVPSLSSGVSFRFKTGKAVGASMLLKLNLVWKLNHKCQKLMKKINSIEGVAISL